MYIIVPKIWNWLSIFWLEFSTFPPNFSYYKRKYQMPPNPSDPSLQPALAISFGVYPWHLFKVEYSISTFARSLQEGIDPGWVRQYCGLVCAASPPAGYARPSHWSPHTIWITLYNDQAVTSLFENGHELECSENSSNFQFSESTMLPAETPEREPCNAASSGCGWAWLWSGLWCH